MKVKLKKSYTIILGDKERDNKTISYRKFGSMDTTTLSQDEFIDMINKVIIEKI